MTIEEAIYVMRDNIANADGENATEAFNMAVAALHAQQEAPKLPEFTVIDTKTGAYPDCEKIALHEDWAKGLIYCDIDCFCINEDGALLLMDDCGNVAYCPDGRFRVVFQREAEKNEPLTLEDLKQMDGQPVYVTKRCWGSCAIVNGIYLTYNNGMTDLASSLLGVGGNIYRHPPKEA